MHGIVHGNWAATTVMVKFLDKGGEVKGFLSMTDASRYLGLDSTAFGHRFDNKKYLNVVYGNKEHGDHQIKLATDPDFGNPIYFVDGGTAMAVGIAVIDYLISPFHEVIYKSFSDYSRKTGISSTMVIRAFAKNSQPVLPNLRRLKKLDNFEEWVTTDPILDYLKDNNGKSLVILNEDGNEPPTIVIMLKISRHGYSSEFKEELELAETHRPFKRNGKLYYTYNDFIRSEWYKKWGNRFGEYKYHGLRIRSYL